jgi:GntR family transcriptional repressor for pyruvate dehydrogenase complex
MTLDAIARPPSLVEKVCEQLAQIARRDQQEDDGWLPTERELSAQLGVSRSVVREATKRLESQGLVEIQHGVGIRAVDKLHKPLSSSLALLIPDEEERLRQLIETRMIIEPQAARMAAAKATAAQLRGLKSIHRQLIDAPNTARAIMVDMEFHHALAEAAGNLIFRLILDSLAELGLASRLRTIGRVGKEKAIEHHAVILAALEKHDPDAAESAMRHHLTAAELDMALRPASPSSRRASTTLR